MALQSGDFTLSRHLIGVYYLLLRNVDDAAREFQNSMPMTL